MMKSSPRPKANPKRSMTTSPRPKINPFIPKAIEERSTRALAKGGKVSEYGGKENYKSKASMMKHEGMESPAAERAEKKMAKGGMCRGMGAATKGGTYKG